MTGHSINFQPQQKYSKRANRGSFKVNHHFLYLTTISVRGHELGRVQPGSIHLFSPVD